MIRGHIMKVFYRIIEVILILTFAVPQVTAIPNGVRQEQEMEKMELAWKLHFLLCAMKQNNQQSLQYKRYSTVIHAFWQSQLDEVAPEISIELQQAIYQLLKIYNTHLQASQLTRRDLSLDLTYCLYEVGSAIDIVLANFDLVSFHNLINVIDDLTHEEISLSTLEMQFGIIDPQTDIVMPLKNAEKLPLLQYLECIVQGYLNQLKSARSRA